MRTGSFLLRSLALASALNLVLLLGPATGRAQTPPPDGQPGTEQPGTKPGTGTPPATDPVRPADPPRTVTPPPPPPPDERARPFAPGKGLEIAPGAAAPAGVIPGVQTSYGSVKLLALLQARMNMPLRNFSSNWQSFSGRYSATSLTNTEQNIAFQAERIRLILTGTLLTKNLEYMFQGDAVGNPFALDVKFTYHLPWVKGLSVTFGRFLSSYSLLMSRLVTRLETTEYPIFLTEGGYAPWRDVGVQIAYAHNLGTVGTLSAYLGIFNGEPNGWTDTNDMKDFLLRVDFLGKTGPLAGLWTGAYALLSFPSCRPLTADPASATTATCVAEEFEHKKFDTDVRAGVFVEWQRAFGMIKPHVMTEGYLRKYTPRAGSGAEFWDVLGGGLWFHAGVLIGKYVEPVIRADFLSTSHQTGGGGDWAARLTVGVNFYLQAIQSHLKLDYVFQSWGRGYTGKVQWTDVDKTDLTATLVPERSFHMLTLQLNTEF